MTFPNHIIGFMKPKGLAFCAEYQAVYDEFTNKPSAADAVIQNAKMLAIVAGGRYAKSERHWEFSVHTNAAGEAQLDWIDPAVNPPVTNVNGCAWDAYEGFTGNNAANQSIRLNFNCASDGTIIGQNNICAIIGVGTDLADTIVDFGGRDASNNCLKIISRYSNNYAYFECNSSSQANTANTNGKRHFAVSRGNAANYDIYLNLVKTTATKASTGLVDIELYILAWNNQGLIVERGEQVRYCSILSYLTEGEVQSAIGDENTYLTNYGTNLY